MKKLLIGLLTLSSLSSLAGVLGTPDQDPVIKNLVNRFSKGKEPTKNDLIGYSFRCKEMSAKRDDFRKGDYDQKLTFEEFDGFVIAKQGDTTMNNILYTFNGQELIGSASSSGGIIYDAYRIDDNGYLLSEFSFKHPRLSISSELYPLSDSQGKVQTYTVCIKVD